MSEDPGAPPSIAHGLYGPDGPISGSVGDPRVQAIIDGGKARPDPRFDERPSSRPERNEQMFDVARYQPANGADPALMQEFSAIGVRQAQGEKLLGLHEKAMAARQTQLEDTWNRPVRNQPPADPGAEEPGTNVAAPHRAPGRETLRAARGHPRPARMS